jgi:hypothetical protein
MGAEVSGQRSPLLERAVVIAAIAEHLLLLLAPLNVLSPIDPHHIGTLLLHGNLPYRDFLFEYPPLAAFAFILPGLLPSALGLPAMAAQAIALEAVMLWFLRNQAGAVRRYLVISLFVFPFLSGGFDAFPMAAIAVSTLLLAGANGAGWWVAAAGAAIKLSPGAAWVWGRRPVLAGLAALAVAAVVLVVPALLAHSSNDSYIGYSLHRGVEAESMAASTAWVGHELSGEPTRIIYAFRSNEIDGAGGAAVAWEVIAAAAVLGLALACGRDGPTDPWLASFAAVVVFLWGFKVLSPQYVAWPAPLAAVLGGRWFRWWMVVCALTFAVYSFGGSDTTLLLLILLRNLAVLIVGAFAVLAVIRSRSRAGVTTA